MMGGDGSRLGHQAAEIRVLGVQRLWGWAWLNQRKRLLTSRFLDLTLTQVQSLSMPHIPEENSKAQRQKRPYPRSHSKLEPISIPAPSPGILVFCPDPSSDNRLTHFHLLWGQLS